MSGERSDEWYLQGYCDRCGEYCGRCDVGHGTAKDLLLRIVAAFDRDRAGHDMRCLPELVAAIADAREVVR